MKNFDFPLSRSLKLKEVMGYDKHRLVEAGVCVSDLAVHGLEHLFARGLLDPQEIDALILVTQTPDHLMPPTSSIIQGRLALKQDMFCLDINQGCAGFVVGLIQAFLLLEQPAVGKVDPDQRRRAEPQNLSQGSQQLSAHRRCRFHRRSSSAIRHRFGHSRQSQDGRRRGTRR